jgi:hypothetical protein
MNREPVLSPDIWARIPRRRRHPSAPSKPGWQRWRRQLLEQTRDKVIVFAQGYYGIFHHADYSLLLGVKLKDIPPDSGSRQQILAKYMLPARG